MLSDIGQARHVLCTIIAIRVLIFFDIFNISMAMKEIYDIIKAFEAARREGRPTALATVVHVEGSAYRRQRLKKI